MKGRYVKKDGVIHKLIDYHTSGAATLDNGQHVDLHYSNKPDKMKNDFIWMPKEYNPEVKSLLGRSIKALKDNPAGGCVKKGEVGIIIQEPDDKETDYIVNFPSQSRYYVKDPLKSSLYELMPENYSAEKNVVFGKVIELGKWYVHHCKGSGFYYIKPSLIERSLAGYDITGETITPSGSYRGKDNWSSDDFCKDINPIKSLSEIQKFLPNGHPDKISVKSVSMKKQVSDLKYPAVIHITDGMQHKALIEAKVDISPYDSKYKYYLLGHGVSELKAGYESSEYSIYEFEDLIFSDPFVFGKFKINDIVVSLTDNSPWRKAGQMFRVLPCSKLNELWYINDTHSPTVSAWKLATPEEVKLYESGDTILSLDNLEILKEFPQNGFCKSLDPELLAYLKTLPGQPTVPKVDYDAIGLAWSQVSWWSIKTRSGYTEYTLEQLRPFFTKVKPEAIDYTKTVGRYLKILKDTNGICEKKDTYHLILSITHMCFNIYGNSLSFDRIERGEIELMPEGWTPDVDLKNHLVHSEMYHITTDCNEWIIQFDQYTKIGKIKNLHSISYSSVILGGNYFKSVKETDHWGDVSMIKSIRRATSTEILHLNKCIEAGKYVQLTVEQPHPKEAIKEYKVGDYIVCLDSESGKICKINTCLKITESKGKYYDYKDNYGISSVDKSRKFRKATDAEIVYFEYSAGQKAYDITTIPSSIQSKKSRFKVGDWIENPDGGITRVAQIDDNKIYFEDHPLWQVTNPDKPFLTTSWFVGECIVITQEEMEKAFVKEAERRYPKGARVQCYMSDGSSVTGVVSNIYWASGSKCPATEFPGRYAALCFNGKWATILSDDYDYSTWSEEQLLAKARSEYPIGTHYKVLNNKGVPIGINTFATHEAKSVTCKDYIDVGDGFIYVHGKWAEILPNNKTFTDSSGSMQEGCKSGEIPTSLYRPISVRLIPLNLPKPEVELKQLQKFPLIKHKKVN